MDKNIEKRIFSLNKIELREEEDGTVIFEGLAAPYGERASIPETDPWFTEEYAPGAFSRSVREKQDAVLNINHAGLPLARVGSGTLRLTDTSRGLECRAELDAEDPDVKRILPKIKRKDISQMSCAFRVKKSSFDESTDVPHRTIEDVDLYDVSIVTEGAYKTTEASLSQRDRHIVERFYNRLSRDIDMKLRESALPHRAQDEALREIQAIA